MILKIYFLNFLTILLILKRTKSDFTKNCPFIYTVDLTESPKLSNGSYLYRNETIIPPQYVKDYNLTIHVNKTIIKNVHTHKRGCICAVKQCLPICSDEIDKFYENYKSNCVDDGFTKNVTYQGGVVKRRHLLKDFHPIYGKVCDIEKGYMMLPEMEQHNEWTLYENSMLLRHHDRRNLTLTEYCFDIEILDKEYHFLINPIVCGETIDIPWFKIWAMAFSIPFLIITMICYCNLTRPYGTNCKCFVTYLSLVTVSYSLICFYTISGIDLPSTPCQIFGFLIYFTIVAYLTWTCILSYDTWISLTQINNDQPSFQCYSLVGWGVPILMTFLTFMAHISNLPNEWKPGMERDMCAVNTLRWSALIYYYVPCLVVFVFSITLYIWIVIFKRNHNEELFSLFGQEPEPLLDRFGLFFRIFLFMGISWSLDILSYFFRMYFGAEEYFIYFALDLFNACHGLFVFLTFICRKTVLRKIKNKMKDRYSGLFCYFKWKH
ncbi:G-protein coupled receptor Mth2-like [Cochliomyia hominivorax]